MTDQGDRRKTMRLPKDCEVFVREGQNAFRVKSKSLTFYDIGLYSDRALEPGADIEVTIYFKDSNVNFEAKGVVRHCTALQGREAEFGQFLVGVEFTSGHEKGLPFFEDSGRQSRHALSQTIIIEADLRTCYKLVSDVERFPEWNPDVRIVEVKERYPDGKCKQVAFEHQLLFLKVKYTDEYAYDDQDHSMRWRSVAGSSELVNNVGGYSLNALAPKKTAVTFHAEITVSFIPSQRLINYFSAMGVRKAMKSLKALVEKEYQKKSG
jgi:ribosome-associated toxin RatA of RatAB toxin-antitoxin module